MRRWAGPPAVAAMRDSFWFVPALVVLASMASAAALVELDAGGGRELAQWSPRLFGASAEGSRAMLSAIATSMITVAGVVFSITVVILSQASTQYSPRVLRNFMRDRPTQAVLGVFVGVFAYCLVVLRTVRGDDEAFIPSLAVLGGMAYAFVAIGMLIFFIHHVAQSIQASVIVERIAQETRSAVDHLFPERLAQPARDEAAADLPDDWVAVRSARSGYVVAVDAEALLDAARRLDRVVRIGPAIGDFVADGARLLEVGGAEPLEDGEQARLARAVQVDSQRTPAQDASFGLQQLVDVGVKALSPGINDPSTAGLCIDRLGDLLAQLAGRRFPDALRQSEGRLRVIAPAPDFAAMARRVVLPMLIHARGDPQVLERLVGALGAVAETARDRHRRAALLELGVELLSALQQVRPERAARESFEALLDVLRRLDGPPSGMAALVRPGDASPRCNGSRESRRRGT